MVLLYTYKHQYNQELYKKSVYVIKKVVYVITNNKKRGRMKKYLYIVIPFIFTGCASITQGTSQILSFSIDPVEAVCTVNNESGGQVGAVSGKINMLQVDKDNSDLLLNCSAKGYKSKITRIKSSTQTAGVIGVTIDFGITDMLTGAMWKYPEHTTIVLMPEDE